MKEVEEAYMTIADELMERGELQGIKKGIRKGKIEEKQQVLVRQLKRNFSLSLEEEHRILAVHNPDLLDTALDEIIMAKSKEAVLGLLLND